MQSRVSRVCQQSQSGYLAGNGLISLTLIPRRWKVLTYQSSKLLLSDQRNRLGDEIIEACECLKAWERDGFLLSQDVADIETALQGLEEQGISLEKAKNS